MKTKRLLALLLCLVTALGFLPPRSARAADQLVLTSDYRVNGIYGVNKMEFHAEITLNFDSMTATANFAYGNFQTLDELLGNGRENIREMPWIEASENHSATVT
jgi:hypothetical protein